MNTHTHRRIRRTLQERSGMAMLFALFAALVVLGAVTIAAMYVTTTKNRTDHVVGQTELDEAAKAGLDAGIERF